MSMQSALDAYMNSALTSVHTSLPGEVISYDEETHRAKVKPKVDMLMDNGVKIEVPELMDVPVVFPSSKTFDLEFPLDKGDGVLLVFQESDISEWKLGKSKPVATTSSRFNLDAAVAIPGLFSKPVGGNVKNKNRQRRHGNLVRQENCVPRSNGF